MTPPTAMGSDEGTDDSGTKENFIARVVRSEKRSEEYGSEEFLDEDETRDDRYELLYELEVLDHDWGNLFEFSITPTSNFRSKWMVLLARLENTHGHLSDYGVEAPEDLGDLIEDRVYEFEEVDWTEDKQVFWPYANDGDGKTLHFDDIANNQWGEFILPVDEVSEEELQDMGVDDVEEADVEEVDLE